MYHVITEARSEGFIELELVRKPPKVSWGYGGVARAARAALAQRGPGGFKNLRHSSKSEVVQFWPRSPKPGMKPGTKRVPFGDRKWSNFGTEKGLIWGRRMNPQ